MCYLDGVQRYQYESQTNTLQYGPSLTPAHYYNMGHHSTWPSTIVWAITQLGPILQYGPPLSLAQYYNVGHHSAWPNTTL